MSEKESFRNDTKIIITLAKTDTKMYKNACSHQRSAPSTLWRQLEKKDNKALIINLAIWSGVKV